MSTPTVTDGGPRSAPRVGWPIGLGLVVGGAGLALVVAFLAAADLWHLSIVLLLVGPAFYLFNRYPLAAVIVWLIIDPFLMASEGGAARQIYWLVHRALPLGAVLLILVGRWIGVREQRFPTLGWPEALMGGYLLFTIVSISYRSLDTTATFIYMYDHVLVPLSIYLLVRLLAPDEDDLRLLVPVVGFFLVAQALVGAVSLVAPDALPGGWVNREERTTGTLRHPNVYGVSLLFAGLYVAHYGQVVADRPRLRRLATLLLLGAVGMAVATLSRATWLAVFVVVVGLFFVYRHLARRIVLTGAAVVVVAVMVGGAFTSVGDTLSERLYSDTSADSALSRLPVVVASLRMIERRPLVGWGYENFDRYDQQFQSSIDGVFVPDKDHASHNLFLTLGAEGGFLGLILYLGPAAIWLYRTPGGLRRLPTEGFRSRKLVLLLWLAMAAQVVVYNFSNNRVAFGLSLWWLTLGLLATLLDWKDEVADEATADVRERIDHLAGDGPASLGRGEP